MRSFIDTAHWQTDGEWKESVLRDILSRTIPETARIGRGFILNQDHPSTQIDILVYRHDTPVFFRDGNLVFIPPEGVLAVVEVKSIVNTTSLKEALLKLSRARQFVNSKANGSILFGLFCYETNISGNESALNILKEVCSTEDKVIDLICLGSSTFIKWWNHKPNGGSEAYNKWHSYTLEGLAPGYFIHNILMHTTTDRYWLNQDMWFPAESKEFQKDGEIGLT